MLVGSARTPDCRVEDRWPMKGIPCVGLPWAMKIDDSRGFSHNLYPYVGFRWFNPSFHRISEACRV